MTIRVTKTATDRATARNPTFFYESAREGMKDFLKQLATERPGLRVLLPAFIGWSPHEGSGVFDPVRELNLPSSFYAVHEDLSADVEDLAARLAEGGPTVVVLIHYFGRTDPSLDRIAAVVEECDAVLVEDLAHGFFTARSSGPAGRHGGVLLFSLHKMFPTPGATGGMVTYRDLSLVGAQTSSRTDLSGFLLDYDWRTIGERRRAHHDDLDKRLRALRDEVGGFDMLWPELPGYDVPQTLPVRILGTGRDDIYTRMNAEGLGMVSLYHTLIPELREIPEMAALARTIINFPVHQDMRPDQRGCLVEAFAAALSTRSDE